MGNCENEGWGDFQPQDAADLCSLVNTKGLRTSLYGFGGDVANLQEVSEVLKKVASEPQ